MVEKDGELYVPINRVGHDRKWDEKYGSTVINRNIAAAITPLRLSNVLEDSLHPILDELEIPRTGMHAFRRGRISEWVYSGVKREVIRDWVGHGSDKLIDLYTKKMWEYHAPEMSKVKPLLELDSNRTQAAREESGASAQRVVN